MDYLAAMQKKKALPYIAVIVLAVIALGIRKCQSYVDRPSVSQTSRKANSGVNVPSTRGLNRNPAHIKYSKHARCRMDCRHITESEIVEILKNGKINYRKSDLKGSECTKKYAVEGVSSDKQRIRIIFAPCKDEVTVVTCIDLDKEWECDCDTLK